jgi:hypothetical protein
MSTEKKLTIKEKLKAALSIFKGEEVAPAPAPAPAPATVGKSYKLADGTEISVVQAGDTIAKGDSVTIAGVPAMAGVLTLEDGSTVTVDATGIVTEVAPAPAQTQQQAPAPAPTTVAPAPVPTPVAPAAFAAMFAAVFSATEKEQGAKELQKMFDSFASGSTDERVANLEVVCKALMEYNFGWKIQDAARKATEDAAVAIYQNELKTATAAMAKHEKVIGELFGIVAELAEVPTEEPATLTEREKQKFSRQQTKEDRLERIGNKVAEIRATKNK